MNQRPGGRPPRRPTAFARLAAIVTLAAATVCGSAGSAFAVPSFSDQTGEACSACHVGSFGPQLNAHGRQFKLTGYADGQKERSLPLVSGMAEASFTHTAKAQDGGAAPGFRDNNNAAADQISLFLAGRVVDHLGVFSQTTWDGVGHRFAWDNTDLRYGREFQPGGVDAIVGVSLNNAPTVTDPYNTLPAWGFPFASSKLAPKPAAATLIEGGLAQRVAGATAYGLIADTLYVEVGGYRALSSGTLKSLGVTAADGAVVDGVAPYWRVALQRETLQQSMSFGTFGMVSNVFPDNVRAAGTDRVTDLGIDASYQWHASKNHVFSAYGSAIFENRKLSASAALGGAETDSGRLNSFRLNGSYYFQQSYGLTLGAFKTTGSADAGLYAPAAIGGSANGRPNSTGYVIQADWTPFGKQESWASPWANLRLAAQYTGYTKFNGGSTNYDGAGRNASDNNTLWLLAWTAF